MFIASIAGQIALHPTILFTSNTGNCLNVIYSNRRVLILTPIHQFGRFLIIFMVFDKVSFDEVISMLSESSVISTKIYSFGIINIPPSSPTGFFYIFIITYFLYKLTLRILIATYLCLIFNLKVFLFSVDRWRDGVHERQMSSRNRRISDCLLFATFFKENLKRLIR